MEISSDNWLTEMGLDDSSFFGECEYQTNELGFQAFSPEPTSCYSSFKDHSHMKTVQSFPNDSQTYVNEERPAQQLKTNNYKPCSSSSSKIISFANSNSTSPAVSRPSYGAFEAGKDKNMDFSSTFGQETKSRTPLLAQEHVLAERKRREKLSQRFIALAALLPGLKKNDKASILGDAIKSLTQLQNRIKTIEEQEAKTSIESVIFVKKSCVYIDDKTENFLRQSEQPLPEIEARLSGKDVLIRIHCKKTKGCAVNVLSEVEKLSLSVLNSNVLPFGDSTLDITIIAKMDMDFSMTLKDLVEFLRLAILNFN